MKSHINNTLDYISATIPDIAIYTWKHILEPGGKVLLLIDITKWFIA